MREKVRDMNTWYIPEAAAASEETRCSKGKTGRQVIQDVFIVTILENELNWAANVH